MKKLFFVISALVMSATMMADTLSLTLVEAQDYALQQNRSLKNASLAIQQSKMQRWQAIASMLPQVQGTVGYTTMFDYSINFGSMTSGIDTQKLLADLIIKNGLDIMDYIDTTATSYSSSSSRKMLPYVNAGIQASIAFGAQLVVASIMKKMAVEMQSISYAQDEADLRSNVATSYVAVLVMQDMLQLLDSSLINVQSLAEMAQKAVDVGASEQTAADQIKVRVNTLKNSINTTERNLELSKNSLKVLLDVPAETELVLTSGMDELLSAEAVLNLLGQDFIIDNNFNYQLLTMNTKLARKNVTLAAVAYVPTLSAYYQYSYRHDFGEGGFSMAPPHTAGVTLTMPLFTSGKNGANIKEKQLAYEAAQNTLAETKDNLGIQYQQLRFDLQNAYEAYTNEKENMEVTQRVFTSATHKYHLGAASNLELTNASNDLINAQNSYVQAIMKLVNAQVELENFLNNK